MSTGALGGATMGNGTETRNARDAAAMAIANSAITTSVPISNHQLRSTTMTMATTARITAMTSSARRRFPMLNKPSTASPAATSSSTSAMSPTGNCLPAETMAITTPRAPEASERMAKPRRCPADCVIRSRYAADEQ
ncbi:Uncharacterised protein [Mycobacteroides abscessus subsp. abscessus]|nr:Uncharacterised protein [Mycobacteroides abscessus subsp. abscessus]